MVKNKDILRMISGVVDETDETIRSKAIQDLVKLRDQILKEMKATLSLAVSSLDLKQVQTCLKLVYAESDPELDEVPSRILPDDLVRRLHRIRNATGRSRTKEASIRRSLNALVTFVHDIATENCITLKPISVLYDHLWTAGPVIHENKTWNLTGRLDYSVWYESKEETSLKVVVVEAKRALSASLRLPQALAYMGLANKLRKEQGKRNCTVYGVACDDQVFHFLKINDNSAWSERIVVTRTGNYEQVFGLLVFMMGRALALSP